MLKTITDYISNIDNISFNLFYMNYIMRVQDIDLENEFKQLDSTASVNIYNVSKLIESTYKGLTNL